MKKKSMSPQMKKALAALAALPEDKRRKVAERVRTKLLLAEQGYKPKVSG